MSVRIYQLSKEIGMENAELLDILRERGFQVKSASSTIDNISAESIKEEFASDKGESESAPESVEEVVEAAPVTPPSAASFVRTKDEIEQEKEEAVKEAPAAKSAPPPLLSLIHI